MTSISSWLRMEEKDRSEPVSFYAPGAVERWAKDATPSRRDYEEWEVQAIVDLWSRDEQ